MSDPQSVRKVFLMRGLPSCGKSHTSRVLAGPSGVICETDKFFFTEVGGDPSRFDYDVNRSQEARQWNFDNFVAAIDAGRGLVVVDRGNGLNMETKRFAIYAVEREYQVEFAEPRSEWWQELRVLLKYKDATSEILDQWALRLAKLNRSTHRTPATTIRRWMSKWRHGLTVEDVLNFEPAEPLKTA